MAKASPFITIIGVDGTFIDAELGKVTVSGYVHPNVLIKKLVKSGKHAELWTAAKNNLYAVQNRPKNQLQDLQFDKLSKPQKGGNGYTKDLNMIMGPKAPKTVKFDLMEDELNGSDGGFTDPEDGGDGFELDFGRRPPARTPTRGGGGYGQHGQKEKKNGPNGLVKNGKNGRGEAKKRGFFGIRLLFFRGFGGKKKSKNSSAPKKGGSSGSAKGGCVKPGAIEFKNGGKNGGWVLENGKNGGKESGAAKSGGNNFKGDNNRMNGGGKNSRGGGKASDFQEIDFGNHRKGSGGGGGGGSGGYGGGGFAGGMGPMGNYPVGQMGNNSMGPMGPWGNYQMGPLGNNAAASVGHYPAVSQMGSNPTHPMGNYQAVHGLPAPAPSPAPISGGYYQGMGPMNHQYTGMMMNQPPYGQLNGMFHSTMYGRPPPMMGYMPHRASDGYTNMFNDENTESCSIM